MKRILLALLLFPQIVFAQYSGDVFTLDSRTIPTEQRSLGLNIQKDTVISLGVRGSIYGLSVTGTVNLENDQDSYVRVILRDDHNYEYLVYECFPLLTETLTPQFQNTALETKSLDGITPQSIRVELKNALISLDSFGYVPESEAAKGTVVNSAVLQREQSQNIVDMLNRNLIAQNKTWRAKVTSMAEKSFEEKKSMFGGEMPQLYGFDYYSGGILVMPYSESTTPDLMGINDRTITYVTEWDWRNRHGRNWMTDVKAQGNCGCCYAFSTIGTLEAYVNLYYNRLTDSDLSEQELVSCSITNNGCSGGSFGESYKYFKQNGIVDETCFEYYISQPPERSCSLKCSSPTERIVIEDYESYNYLYKIFYGLYKHPISFNIKPWKHSMVLTGYKTIALGDQIFFDTDSAGGHDNNPITISQTNHQNLINQRAWLLKNSWGINWGQNGYGYVVTNESNIGLPYAPKGKVTSLWYNDSDIVCKDRDGDGYYFWGIGDRPNSLPTWVPDSIDGNDNDPEKGILYLDSLHVIGELETINPNGIQTLTINSNTTYTTRQYKRTNIVVASNKTLTVKNILNMFGRPTITVQSGGQLIIDGGVITNAYIILASGAKLVLKNGGKIVMRTNTDFIAQVGALVDITYGEILRSNDF